MCFVDKTVTHQQFSALYCLTYDYGKITGNCLIGSFTLNVLPSLHMYKPLSHRLLQKKNAFQTGEKF